MYSITVLEDVIKNADGFRLLSETTYMFHPAVKKVELWVKGERSENGKLTRYNMFCITYQNNSVSNVIWKNFDPKYYRMPVCVSYDGRLLFLPDYEKGITVIEISTNSERHKYNLKHIFSIWATDTSLLCLHRESNRVITRLDFKTNEVKENVEADGLDIVPLLTGGLLYKKDSQYYVIADSNNLTFSFQIAVKDFMGYDDANFNISWASYENGDIAFQYFCTDPADKRKIVSGKKRFQCPSELNSFIQIT